MPNRLPLREVHREAGAKLSLVCDWELPESYGDPAAEYRAVRTGVGSIDRGALGVVEVTGRDRASFMNAILSNDVKSLVPGTGCAATLLDVHGKVETMLVVLALEDRLLVLTPPGSAARAIEAFDKYLFSEKAYLRNASGELALLMLAGPRARETAEQLAGVVPADSPWAHLTGKLDDREVRIMSGGRETGEAEVWLVAAASDGANVWRAALGAGARPVGLTAFESLRIEAGTPVYGHDVDETVLLPEIPLASLVSYTKGCYVGQEVVVRIRDRGHVNRSLQGLVLEGDAVPVHGASVLSEGREVGRVTSATRSLGMNRPIALAFVRREHAEPGTALAVQTEDRLTVAIVAALPFAR